MHSFEELKFDNIYHSLPEGFYSRHQPTVLEGQRLVHFNSRVASTIGLDPAEAGRKDLVQLLTSSDGLPGLDPIAMCYSGHQFGNYVPRLGDGRALLLGQINHNGQRWDLQLKGAGLTLYSRQGDGKAVLRSTIREHLCSAAMQGLGIPTTLSLAMFGSDEEVYRERIEPGAMLIRVAPSHIRFGSFEYFYYTNKHAELRKLADFTIGHYFQDIAQNDEKYLEFLKTVVRTTADMIARWQSVGFCHGVMNSDNMSIHGITIDYGPFGFLDGFDARHICNHSDHSGRYAFNQQPRIGLFNLSCLAQALLPLIDENPDTAAAKATEALEAYPDIYADFDVAASRKKLGLHSQESTDGDLYNELLNLLQQDMVDFTNFFRKLSTDGIDGCRVEVPDREAFDIWSAKYQKRVARDKSSESERSILMTSVNPVYVLRNYLAEQAIREAEDNENYTEIDRLISILENPYVEHPNCEAYRESPPDWAAGLSVSCSS